MRAHERCPWCVYLSAGNPDGIPLVLQHTAGSDGRQWRHLLEDVAVGRHFHLLAEIVGDQTRLGAPEWHPRAR